MAAATKHLLNFLGPTSLDLGSSPLQQQLPQGEIGVIIAPKALNPKPSNKNPLRTDTTRWQNGPSLHAENNELCTDKMGGLGFRV